MKTSEVLIKARDYLMEHGWCRYALVDIDGKVCARGAILAAVKGTPLSLLTGLSKEADELLRSVVVEGKWSKWRWVEPSGRNAHVFFNNHEDTTFNDVMDLFDRAIIKAKEQEA